jgi:hypothetical protein
MLRLFSFISSILLLVFFYFQVTSTKILVIFDGDDFLSKYIIQKVPPIIFTILFITILVLLVKGLYSPSRKLAYVNYFVSLAIFNIAFIITVDLVQLESMSEVFIFKIYHPIPIETKLEYFRMQLTFFADQLSNDRNLIFYLENILNTRLNKNLMLQMNAQELTMYARDFIVAALQNINDHPISRNYIKIERPTFSLLAIYFLIQHVYKYLI